MRGNKSLIVVLFLLMISSTAIGQSYMNDPYRTNRNRSVVPRANTMPDKEDYDKIIQEKLEVHINNYVNGLEVDEFQKHIIKQKLESYYSERMAIVKKEGMDRDTKKKSIEYLENNHFNDIKNITSAEVQESIQEFIRTDPNTTSNKKEKRKKKKRIKGKGQQIN